MTRGFYAYAVSRDGVVRYIGITVRGVAQRWAEHLKANSQNTALANALRKYGASAFVCEHIATARNNADLAELERILIVQFATMSPQGYNLKEGGIQNFIFSEETRRRMRARQLGKKLTPETLAKMAASRAAANHTPYRPSAEARAKMSASRSGKKFGPMSAERKANIAAAKRGKPGAPVSPEARAKIAASKIGKPGHIPTAETRAKMSAARIGKPHVKFTAETKRKMSISARARRQREKCVNQPDLLDQLPVAPCGINAPADSANVSKTQ